MGSALNVKQVMAMGRDAQPGIGASEPQRGSKWSAVGGLRERRKSCRMEWDGIGILIWYLTEFYPQLSHAGGGGNVWFFFSFQNLPSWCAEELRAK